MSPSSSSKADRQAARDRVAAMRREQQTKAVSYTHLTLPTSDLV